MSACCVGYLKQPGSVQQTCAVTSSGEVTTPEFPLSRSRTTTTTSWTERTLLTRSARRPRGKPCDQHLNASFVLIVGVMHACEPPIHVLKHALLVPLTCVCTSITCYLLHLIMHSAHGMYISADTSMHTCPLQYSIWLPII